MTIWVLLAVCIAILVLGGLAIRYIPMAPGGPRFVGILVIVLCILICIAVLAPGLWRTLDIPANQLGRP